MQEGEEMVILKLHWKADWYSTFYFIAINAIDTITGYTCYNGTKLLKFYMMTSSNGNIVRVTGHLCREFTVPVTRGFNVFFDLHPNKQLSKQSWGWWF